MFWPHNGDLVLLNLLQLHNGIGEKKWAGFVTLSELPKISSSARATDGQGWENLPIKLLIMISPVEWG